ncbi:hypothetical protein [Burkholderia cepacia]|uniref:hypothetical protein n=1 Tax=Burkholderia cepacia TaxID=292 RepID=UPI00069E2AAE|nr:hypothetical protein [Burkholderia cepacia]
MRAADLTEYERKILTVPDTQGGVTIGDVAHQMMAMSTGNHRMHAGAIRWWFVQLERPGLVKRLDEEKPVCWIKIDQPTNN